MRVDQVHAQIEVRDAVLEVAEARAPRPRLQRRTQLRQRRSSRRQSPRTVAGGGSQIDAAALLRASADKIATGLVTAIFPIQIAAVQGDGSIILNFGEGALRQGDYLMVYGEASEIPDPSGTGMIKIDGQKLGAIQVTEVQSAFSRAVAVTEFANGIPIGAIARPVSDDDIDDLKRSKRRRR